MSIAFPAIPIRSFRLTMNENKARFESPFTRQRQVVSLSGGTGDLWEGLLSTPILVEADAETFFSFLIEVGLFGQFTFGIPNYDGPASGENLGAVQGAGQSGKSLICDGFTPSITVARKGDYFQVRNELKRLTADAASNASGVVTFEFRPALRVSPADNDPVDLGSPVMLAELMTMPSMDMDFQKLVPFTIAFQEKRENV